MVDMETVSRGIPAKANVKKQGRTIREQGIGAHEQKLEVRLWPVQLEKVEQRTSTQPRLY
jgi:hypothetical protein